MIVYCPVCGTDNEASVGARVSCRGCSAAFEAPSATQPPAPAPVAPPPPAQSPMGWAASPGPGTQAPMMAPQGGVSSFGQGQAATTNMLAIVSLVFGIVCCIPLISPGTAIVCGILAMKQIDESGGAQKGKGLAIAGIVLGGLTVLMNIIGLIGNIAQRM